MRGAAPPDPSREDGRWGGGEGARGGAAGASPTSRPPPGATRAGRGMGACRGSPFVPRRGGRSGGRGALSSLGRDGTEGFPARAPPPRARRRSYRGPAAAACSRRSAFLPARARAAAAARRAPGREERERSEPKAAAARSRSGRGRQGPGRLFIFS